MSEEGKEVTLEIQDVVLGVQSEAKQQPEDE